MVSLFSSDNGKLGATECILIGLLWPFVLAGYALIYGFLFLTCSFKSVVSYIKEYKYKMYVNKQIVDMVKKFNNKIE